MIMYLSHILMISCLIVFYYCFDCCFLWCFWIGWLYFLGFCFLCFFRFCCCFRCERWVIFSFVFLGIVSWINSDMYFLIGFSACFVVIFRECWSLFSFSFLSILRRSITTLTFTSSLWAFLSFERNPYQLLSHFYFYSAISISQTLL